MKEAKVLLLLQIKINLYHEKEEEAMMILNVRVRGVYHKKVNKVIDTKINENNLLMNKKLKENIKEIVVIRKEKEENTKENLTI